MLAWVQRRRSKARAEDAELATSPDTIGSLDGEQVWGGEPPFGLFYTLTGHGLLHLALLGGLYQYIDTVEWKVLLFWAIPPLLHGWLHGRNPLLWLFLSPQCLAASGLGAGAALSDGLDAHVLGLRVSVWDAAIDALQWLLMVAGGLTLFLAPPPLPPRRAAASYAPAALLLALALALPAWQMRALTRRVVRLVRAAADGLDARWSGMKVLAQVYSLWARARLPLCLLQCGALIAAHALGGARDRAVRGAMLTEVLLFAAVCAAGHRFHGAALRGLEELAPPPARLLRRCALFAALVGADVALKLVELHVLAASPRSDYYADFDVPESLAWITLFTTVTLNFYFLALTLIYLTYNRHVLDDVLVLVTTMGIYRTASGEAPVPEWMYSQASHPSTTVLSPHIIHFCIMAPPTMAILGVHFFQEAQRGADALVEQILFLDMLVGVVAVLLCFFSFLAESLLGARVVRRCVVANLAFTLAATAFRLFMPYELSSDGAAAGKALPPHVLYSLVVRNALFWIILSLSFCAAVRLCATSLISGSLWAGLGLREDYLEAPETVAAARAAARPARPLLGAFALLMAYDVVLWVACTAEDACSAASSLAQQVGLTMTLCASVLLFFSVVVVRLWRPVRVGRLYAVECALALAFAVNLAAAVGVTATAHLDSPAIRAQMYLNGALRLLLAALLAYDARSCSWLRWRAELRGCEQAYLRARYRDRLDTAPPPLPPPADAEAATPLPAVAAHWDLAAAIIAEAVTPPRQPAFGSSARGSTAPAAAATAVVASAALGVAAGDAGGDRWVLRSSSIGGGGSGSGVGSGGGRRRRVRRMDGTGEIIWVSVDGAPAVTAVPSWHASAAAGASHHDPQRCELYAYVGGGDAAAAAARTAAAGGGVGADSALPPSAAVTAVPIDSGGGDGRVAGLHSGAWLRRMLPDGTLEWVRGTELREELADLQRLVTVLNASAGGGGSSRSCVAGATAAGDADFSGSFGSGGGGCVTSDTLATVAVLPFEAKRAWLRRQLSMLQRGDAGRSGDGSNSSSGGGGGDDSSAHQAAALAAAAAAAAADDFYVRGGTAATVERPSAASGTGDDDGGVAAAGVQQPWLPPWHQPQLARRRQVQASEERGGRVAHSAAAAAAAAALGTDEGVVMLEVSRAALLESSAAAFEALSAEELRLPMKFRFAGESAIDAGGVGREWFELVAEALFAPTLGLFAYAPTDNMTHTINAATARHFRTYAAAARAFGTLPAAYRFAGRFLGKAMLEEKPLPIHLSRTLYKHVLGAPVTARDLQFVDPKLHKNLEWLRSHQGADVLSLDFSTMEVAGHAPGGRERYEVLELVPGGRDLLVTDANKHEYIEVATKFKLLDRISAQLAALLAGFYEVIPPGLLVVFGPQELELLTCGLDVIDVDDWAAHTAHLGALRPTHRLVRWFWDVVRDLDQAARARLLQFVTGTSRVPLGGFRALRGADGEARAFTLAALPPALYDPRGAYPMAHTCFNRLDLPLYGDREALRRALAAVVQLELATGFGKE